MDFKPQDFFIGLVEFISIMLPGGVLAAFGLFIIFQPTICDVKGLLNFYLNYNTNVTFLIVYILSSFGLGYFLSSFASGLDILYDKFRKQFSPYTEDIENKFIEKMLPQENRKKLKEFEKINFINNHNKEFQDYKDKYLNNILRQVINIIFKLQKVVKIDSSYDEAKIIHKNQPKSVSKSSNLYKWATTILDVNYPMVSIEIKRTMAASKFFRSMIIVTLITTIFTIYNYDKSYFQQFIYLNLVVLFLSFREYVVQRQKCVQKTYQSIIALTHYKTERKKLT